MIPLLPSELLALGRETDLWPTTPVALDTETSGLYADDGARVSTVSLAWEDDADGSWSALSDRGNYDIEMYAKRPEGGHFGAAIFSLAWPFDQGVEGKPEDTGQRSLFDDEATANLPLSEWLSLCAWLLHVKNSVGLVMHNGKFDCEKMRVGVRRWPGMGVDLIDGLVWDTQNVNHLLWPLQPHPDTGKPTTSLKPTCSVLFEEDAADEQAVVKGYLKAQKLPPGRWDLMPWDVIGAYADKDARLTKRLELRQVHEIQSGGAGEWLGSPQEVLMHAWRRLETTKVLYRMEKRGLPYDEVGSRDAADLCRARAKEAASELPFEPTPPKAKQYFFGQGTTSRGVPCLNMVPYAVTDKGEPSMTAEVVARMVDDNIPHADVWAEYQKASTAASMWYEGYADAIGTDGRLRTCFRQNGTVSSRFSVERVNLQAIPQDYRLTEFSVLEGIPTPRQLIASAVDRMPGWSLWELDLAQAELRVASMFANCERMLKMIANDEDLHTFTTLALFPDVSADDPLFKSKWRQVGKRGNFSLLFGAKGNTFKRMVSKETGIRLEDHEADRIVRDWNALYPEFSRAIEKHSGRVAVRQAREGRGWIDLVNGERRWFERHEEQHKAFNQRVQGNLAQFGIEWMLESDRFLRDEGLDEAGAGLVLTIHDSQVLLLPDADGERMARSCAAIGKRLWDEWFPGVPGAVDFKRWSGK